MQSFEKSVYQGDQGRISCNTNRILFRFDYNHPKQNLRIPFEIFGKEKTGLVVNFTDEFHT